MQYFKDLISYIGNKLFFIESFMDTIHKNDKEKFNWYLANRVTPANINHTNSEGVSPLQLTFIYHNNYMTKRLLESGADVYTTTPNGDPLIFNLCSARPNLKVPYDFWSMPDDFQKEYNAAEKSKQNKDWQNQIIQVLDKIVPYAKDFDIKKQDGETLLHNCIKHKNFLVANYLIHQGANPFIQNKEKIIALDLLVKDVDNDPNVLFIINKCLSSESIKKHLTAMNSTEPIEKIRYHLSSPIVTSKSHSEIEIFFKSLEMKTGLEEKLIHKPVYKKRKI